MISIIIPSRTDEYCERVLQSLVSIFGSGDGKVIIIDSGLSSQFRTCWEPRVSFVQTALPFNFSTAINDGVKAASPDSDLLLLNDDCEMRTRDFYEKLTAVLIASETHQYGVISLRIEGGVGNPDQRTIAEEVLLQPTKKTVCFVAVLIRREAWNQVGSMDEFFVGSFGDDDWCWRARAAGWKCGVTGMASVRHGFPGRALGNSFFRYLKPEEHQAHSRAARDYFFKKHGTVPDPAHWKI